MTIFPFSKWMIRSHLSMVSMRPPMIKTVFLQSLLKKKFISFLSVSFSNWLVASSKMTICFRLCLALTSPRLSWSGFVRL